MNCCSAELVIVAKCPPSDSAMIYASCQAIPFFTVIALYQCPFPAH